MDEDDKNLSDEELKKRYQKIAQRRVKLAILMQQIANEHKITVTEKELTDGMLNYAAQYPGKEKQIFEYFKKNPSIQNCSKIIKVHCVKNLSDSLKY